MSVNLVKVYRISSIDVWPYERVLEAVVQPAISPIVLSATFSARNPEHNAGHRVYTVHPREYIEWSLVEPYESREEFFTCDEISSEQLLPADAAPWLQVDHVLFSSRKAEDRAKLRKLHKFVQEHGTEGLDIADDLGPLKVELCVPDSPRWDWHEQGEFTERARSSLFISSLQPSNIPQINFHTIPKGCEYEFVTALITHYYQPAALPTYIELLERQHKYAKWFHSVSGSNKVPEATR